MSISLCKLINDCVFINDRVDWDQEVGGTFFYLPLVCNVEVIDDTKEDKFVIELKLKILNLEELRASEWNNHVFITHRNTFSDRSTFTDRFNTRIAVRTFIFSIMYILIVVGF